MSEPATESDAVPATTPAQATVTATDVWTPASDSESTVSPSSTAASASSASSVMSEASSSVPPISTSDAPRPPTSATSTAAADQPRSTVNPAPVDMSPKPEDSAGSPRPDAPPAPTQSRPGSTTSRPKPSTSRASSSTRNPVPTSSPRPTAIPATTSRRPAQNDGDPRVPAPGRTSTQTPRPSSTRRLPVSSQPPASTTAPRGGNGQQDAAEGRGSASPSSSAGPTADGLADSDGNMNRVNTLSSAVSVTITSDGQTLTTAPALVTGVTSSSGVDGPVTLTSVFANPTGVSGIKAEDSFLNKPGAVAGVFIVVGVSIIGVIVLLWFICRRRKRSRGLNPSNEHSRRLSIPEMTQGGTYRRNSTLSGRYAADEPTRHLFSPSLASGEAGVQRSYSQSTRHSDFGSSTGHGHAPTGLGLSNVGVGAPYAGPFSEYHRGTPVAPPAAVFMHAISRDSMPPPMTPVVVHNTQRRDAETVEIAHTGLDRNGKPRPASVHSSPSIYPASLPPVPEDSPVDEKFYEKETRKPERGVRPLPKLPGLPSLPGPRIITHNMEAMRELERNNTPLASPNPFSSPFDEQSDNNATLTRDLKGKRKAPTNDYLSVATSATSHTDTLLGYSATSASPVRSAPMTPSDTETEGSLSGSRVNPFSDGFLGRPLGGSMKEPQRPRRNPLRERTTSTPNAELRQ